MSRVNNCNSGLDGRSIYLRELALEALEGGSRGHVGSTMSLIEIMRVLYDDVLRFDVGHPNWADRDRLVLSKGHGCIALYAILADKGFFPRSALATFCQYTSMLGGHPERGHVPGVEASTGSLGHGLAVGVGMAYAARITGRDSNVYVILGDGELNEGSVWESAMAAAHHHLANLTVIVDHNGLQSYGPLADVWDMQQLEHKWQAFGFETSEVNGHDVEQLRDVLTRRHVGDRPRAVIAYTTKGKGIAFAESEPGWHHRARISPDEIDALRRALRDA